MSTETPIQTTGIDLKVARVRAVPRVQAKAVAQAMGITSSRLSRIENHPGPVTPRMRARYLLALETCRTSGTGKVA